MFVFCTCVTIYIFGSERPICESCFSPYTMWALGIKLTVSDWRASLFTNGQREHVWIVMLFTQEANWKSMEK